MDPATIIISFAALAVVFKVKHFVADYPLQGKFMLGKFLPGWGFFLPLLTHVTVHGIFTLAIVWILAPQLWWLALVDMGIHFIMDRIKAGPKYMGRWKPLTAEQYMKALQQTSDRGFFTVYAEGKNKLRTNAYFWISLGFDQMVHGLTDLFIVYMLITERFVG